MSLIESRYKWSLIWNCFQTFSAIKQKEGEDLEDYKKRFDYVVSLFKSQMGNPLVCSKLHELHPEYEADGMKGLRIRSRTGKILYDSAWIAGVGC